jgi:hypothetical protein
MNVGKTPRAMPKELTGDACDILSRAEAYYPPRLLLSQDEKDASVRFESRTPGKAIWSLNRAGGPQAFPKTTSSNRHPSNWSHTDYENPSCVNFAQSDYVTTANRTHQLVNFIYTIRTGQPLHQG